MASYFQPRIWINPSRSVVTGALERYHRVNVRADNTSAVTVFLDPPGKPKREVSFRQIRIYLFFNCWERSLVITQ